MNLFLFLGRKSAEIFQDQNHILRTVKYLFKFRR